MDPIGYYEPETLADAVRLLAADHDARCLAGGQTLVAGMNTGLVRPSALVSLQRIAALHRIDPAPDGSVAVGAMATHKAVAAHEGFRGAHRLLGEAASRIAHPAIRSRGTIGGSICHADPAADYPAVLVALGSFVEAVGPDGPRGIAAGDFFRDFLTTSLRPGELVTRILFPATPAAATATYEKFARADGDFATVSVAAWVVMDRGVCVDVGLALGSCGSVPLASAEANALLRGSTLDEAAVRRAGELLAAAARPADDVRGSAEYRLLLIPRLVAKALRRAAAVGGV